MNPRDDIQLLADIATIKRNASRKGSRAQRWWQNRIYGLNFGLMNEPPRQRINYANEARNAAEMTLADERVSGSKKSNLRGYLSGLNDVLERLVSPTDHQNTDKPVVPKQTPCHGARVDA